MGQVSINAKKKIIIIAEMESTWSETRNSAVKKHGYLTRSWTSGRLQKEIDLGKNTVGRRWKFFLPDIYIPIFGFVILLIIGIIIKNIFYKN